MTHGFILSTSVLSADFANLREQLEQAEAGGADWLHVDVMDGHFVPNLTMGPFLVETFRRVSSLPIDVHLMVDNPDTVIPWYASAGANRISVQVETCPNLYRTLEAIRALGCHPGVVINPGTPAEAVAEVLHLVDLVLIMTVNPGYSGQSFIPAVTPKIERMAGLIRRAGSGALIQVDGGITAETLPQVYHAGARIIVAATAVFRHPDGIAAGIRALRNAVA